MTDGTSQGLFVIVAVVIFGIFVAIAYNLFGDKLKLSLASIFSDSFTQAEKALNGGTTGDVGDINPEDYPRFINSYDKKEDEGLYYINIRQAYTDDSGVKHSDIFVELKEISEGKLKIVRASKNKELGKFELGLYTAFTGEIIFPETVDGKRVVAIDRDVFINSAFTGDFIAYGLETIEGFGTFGDKSNFTGDFIMPSLKEAQGNVPGNFTGDFIANNLEQKVKGPLTFDASFTGDLIINKMENLNGKIFFGTKSKFKGKFEAKSLKIVDNYTGNFYFEGTFDAPNLERIASHTFNEAQFTGDLYLPNITKVKEFETLFSASNFDNVFINDEMIQNFEDFLREHPYAVTAFDNIFGSNIKFTDLKLASEYKK